MPTKKVTEKTVRINNVDYSINSSNGPLLKSMEGGSKKNEQGKWEKQFFPYIPMNIVYQLMDGLFDSYDIYSHPAELTGETFILKKYDGSEEEAKAFRKSIEIVIRD
jgi:hypothetical protein